MTAPALETARAAHQAVLAAFAATARRVPDDSWNRRGEKWSPAQHVEHIRLAYEVVGRELGGGQGLRPRAGFILRTILRTAVLRRILRTGFIPRRAKAPSEVRPGDGPFEKAGTIAALQALGGAFESKLGERWHDPAAVLTHHLFGTMGPPDAFRFMAVHTEHHRVQIEELL